jgi:hypothetical protein
MRRHTAHAIIVLVALTGCKSVHTTRAGGVPVAVWKSLVVADEQGHAVRPDARETVSKVLREHGLHPMFDEDGVSVPDDEEGRAREVLLTDHRLKDSDVIVLLAIPAGTGTRTANGFEVPAVAPASRRHDPTSGSSQ